MPLVTPYPFDPTGLVLSNKVTGEQQILSPMNFQDYNFVVPTFAPFFADGVVVSHKALDNTVTPLVEGIDYYFTHWFVAASRACSKPIYGSISLLNLELTGTLTLAYQTLGGEWTIDETKIAQILADHLHNPRTTSWDNVSGVPLIFPVIDHEWDLQDMVGLSEVIPALQAIEAAILANYDPTVLAGHLLATNPHGITAAMVDAYTKAQTDTLIAGVDGSTAMDAHVAEPDPHTQYAMKTSVDNLGMAPLLDEVFFLSQR